LKTQEEIKHVIRNLCLSLKLLGKHCKKCNGHCPMFDEIKAAEKELKGLNGQ